MYSKNETDISYSYLKKIISKLKEPIVIIGGWAVFLTVNKNYKKEHGIDYIGSRDIDLGFNTLKSLIETSNILEKNGFKLISFRYVKEIDYETGKELTKEEAKSFPQYNIFSMYVDLLISKIPENVIDKIGFIPADEPNIEFIFTNSIHRKELLEFNRMLWLPSSEILLLTKLNSVINRSKDHKRTKDFCDIITLLLYSDVSSKDLFSFIKLNVKKETLLRFKSCLTEQIVLDTSNIIRVNKELVNRVLQEIVN